MGLSLLNRALLFKVGSVGAAAVARKLAPVAAAAALADVAENVGMLSTLGRRRDPEGARVDLQREDVTVTRLQACDIFVSFPGVQM